MSANNREFEAKPTAPGTVPNYRAHEQQQLPLDDEWKSVGDYATSGSYSSGGGGDEPIDRNTIGDTLFDVRSYDRPFGRTLTASQRTRGRYWMREIMKKNFGRSDMSGMY